MLQAWNDDDDDAEDVAHLVSHVYGDDKDNKHDDLPRQNNKKAKLFHYDDDNLPAIITALCKWILHYTKLQHRLMRFEEYCIERLRQAWDDEDDAEEVLRLVSYVYGDDDNKLDEADDLPRKAKLSRNFPARKLTFNETDSE